MRKIVSMIDADNETFEPIYSVKIKNEDGTTETFTAKIHPSSYYKYSPEEQIQINTINQVLRNHNKHLLTNEECEWMFRYKKSKNTDISELQRLSGFTVEKNIVYHDD